MMGGSGGLQGSDENTNGLGFNNAGAAIVTFVPKNTSVVGG